MVGRNKAQWTFVRSGSVQLLKMRQPVVIFFNNLPSDSVLEDLGFISHHLFNVQDNYFLCVAVCFSWWCF